MKKLFSILAFLFWVTILTAQTTTSSIVGYVSDSSGQAVVDVLVTATHTSTGTLYHTTTDSRGRYRLMGVHAGGPYVVKADDFAHTALYRQNVYAPLGNSVKVDFVFQDAAIQLPELVIEAESEKDDFNTCQSGVSTRLDSTSMRRIPSISRSISDLVKQVPQAISNNGSFSMGGGNYRGSSVTVDGASFNNAFGIGSSLPGGGNPISLDAIQELNVSLTPFDVRYSGFNGGVLNMVTKHGTNLFHASVYDYVTGSNVCGQFVGGESVVRSSTLNNLVGLTLGGPIIKDKLFFFLNAEYTTDISEGVTVQPRDNASQAFGAGTGLARPTTSEMETIKQFLSDHYGYDPGRYSGFNISTPDYKLLARLDWNISSNHQFMLRFSHVHSSDPYAPNTSMSPLGGTNTSFLASDGNTYTFNRYNEGRVSPYALPFESARYTLDANLTTLSAELNSRLFDGRANNTLRATWSYQNEPRSYVGDIFPTVDILEPYTDAGGNTQYALFTTFGPDPFTYANLIRVSTINVTDEFSYSLGAHNLLAGIHFEHNRSSNGFMQGGAGWYLFESWSAFASHALPNAFMITHANSDDPTQSCASSFDRNQFSLFLQDQMDLGRYFNLTLGVRFELPFYHFPTSNYNANFAAVAQANPTSSFAGLSTDRLPNTIVNISPRVSFDWDVLHNRRLTVHGGTGLFTGSVPSVWLVSTSVNSNCIQYQYIANINTGLPVMPFAADRGAIINSLYAGSPFHQQDLAAPTSATFFDSDFRMPSSWKSSLTLEADLPGGVKASLDGIFSFSFNEVYVRMLGYGDPTTFQLPGEPESRTTLLSENITNETGAKMGGYLLTNASQLHGWYASLAAQLRKDFPFGLNLMAAYTYSAGRSVNDGLGDQVYEFATPYNVHGAAEPQLGYSASLSPHHLILSLGYTLQQPKSATRFALFYEGFNMGVYAGKFTSRVSYILKANEFLGGSGLLYVPTEEELAAMPFSTTANRDAFEQFIQEDAYLSHHRGEYALRNCATAPWVNRVNLKVSQEFYFTVAGRRQTLEVGADLVNLANLLNSEWGLYQELTNNQLLAYASGQYTFTPGEWHPYNNLRSTWQLLLHLKYSF